MTASQAVTTPATKRRRVALGAVVFAFTSFVCFVLAEVVLRQVVALPLQRPAPEVRYVDDSIRRFRLRPDQRAFTYGAPVVVDGQGYRSNGAASGNGTATAADIFALGDSFTFGMGVRDEETWPARLESELRTRGKEQITVVNGGVISYGAFQELAQLQTALTSMKPRVVVHALYWNDAMSASRPQPGDDPVTADGFLTWDDQNVRESRLRAAAGWLTNHSALITTARKLALAARGSADEGGGYGTAFQTFIEHGLTGDAWQVIEAFYARVLTLSREYGFEPFVVVMPVDDLVIGPTPTQHPYAREARRRLTQLGIPFVDAFTLWERGGYRKELFLPQGHDAHLNANGYRVIARAVADSLLANPKTKSALDR